MNKKLFQNHHSMILEKEMMAKYDIRKGVGIV